MGYQGVGLYVKILYQVVRNNIQLSLKNHSKESFFGIQPKSVRIVLRNINLCVNTEKINLVCNNTIIHYITVRAVGRAAAQCSHCAFFEWCSTNWFICCITWIPMEFHYVRPIKIVSISKLKQFFIRNTFHHKTVIIMTVTHESG